MTIENEVYGGGWQKCSRCGVKDREDQLVPESIAEETGFLWRHIASKATVCAEWKATLERLADLYAHAGAGK